jgi:hypothetical protein
MPHQAVISDKARHFMSASVSASASVSQHLWPLLTDSPLTHSANNMFKIKLVKEARLARSSSTKNPYSDIFF